jgi:hypothetical protein
MSAAPPIAGIRLIPNDRRFVPQGDMCSAAKETLFDGLIGAAEEREQ